ncbi:unnamed protein product [Blepharisma stoltei]|uniref:Uncharacterized protein n=1 Tax=Blepharisma stoltei TaxID=1481888 RepID=A0AAU9JFC7_9CILI|nr:unnamed protein product [Blepharisma stoltei]
MSQRLQSGRWTDEEHKRFLFALQEYGRNWKLISQTVGTRSSSQIKSHAQKYFISLQKEHSEPTQVKVPNRIPKLLYQAIAHLQFAYLFQSMTDSYKSESQEEKEEEDDDDDDLVKEIGVSQEAKI